MAETARETKDSVVEAMAEAGHDRTRLRSVTLTSDGIVSAGCASYPDGSAQIQISEAVQALIPVYSRHLALSVARPSRLLKRVLSRRRPFDTALLAAVLRFTSRVERSSGRVQTLTIDLEPFQQHTADLIAAHSLRFVIAHELAHHLRGPLDADRLAYQAVLAAQHHDSSGPPSLVPLGALVAVAVVHHVEKSLYVRGTSHPPVDSRLGVLWEEVPFHDRSSFNSCAEQLFEATDLAADFTQGSRPAVDWDLLPEAPDHSFVRCDELQSLTPGQLVIELHNWPTIGPGARALLDGRLGDAARQWEIPLARLHGWQSQTPLAAWTLRDGLQKARGLEDLTSLERCPVVEAMAALVEHRVVGA